MNFKHVVSIASAMFLTLACGAPDQDQDSELFVALQPGVINATNAYTTLAKPFLNCRAQAGTSRPLVFELKPGTIVDVVTKKTVNADNFVWIEVNPRGDGNEKTCWVAADDRYLKPYASSDDSSQHTKNQDRKTDTSVVSMPIPGDNDGPLAYPPPTLSKDSDNNWNPMSSVDVYNKTDNIDITADTVVQISTATVIDDTQPTEKYALPTNWADFFKSFSFNQFHYQNPSYIALPPSNRSIPANLAAETEFSPDDEPLPGPGRGSFLSNIDVSHNLRITKSEQRGMAITIRGFIWNNRGSQAELSVFFRDQTGAPITSSMSRYINTQGYTNSGMRFPVEQDRVAFHAVVFLPYYVFSATSYPGIKMQTQLTVNGSTITSSNHVFSLQKSEPIAIRGSGLVQSSGLQLAKSFDNGSRYHAFFANGFADCCFPIRVQNVMKDLRGRLVDESRGFPIAWNFRGWNINTFVVEWDTPDNRSSDILANYNDRETRRHIEDYINSRPGEVFFFIGHSFGGDTLTKIAKCYEGDTSYCITVNRRTTPPPRIVQLALIDPVMAGGVRARYTIGNNVSNLQNYWTNTPTRLTNIFQNLTASIDKIGPNIGGLIGAVLDIATLGLAAIPLDYANTGSLGVADSSRTKARQESFNLARDFAGQVKRRSCDFFENCPGPKTLPSCTFKRWNVTCKRGSNGTKNIRLNHGSITDDDFLQLTMMSEMRTTMCALHQEAQPSIIAACPY